MNNTQATTRKQVPTATGLRKPRAEVSSPTKSKRSSTSEESTSRTSRSPSTGRSSSPDRSTSSKSKRRSSSPTKQTNFKPIGDEKLGKRPRGQLSRAGISRIVKSILAEQIGSDVDVQIEGKAMDALVHVCSESVLSLLRAANTAATHTGRQTIQGRDIKLVSDLVSPGNVCVFQGSEPVVVAPRKKRASPERVSGTPKKTKSQRRSPK